MNPPITRSLFISQMFGDLGVSYPMGVLSVLRGLGRRNPAHLSVLPIPNPDIITSVSSFSLFTIPFSSADVCTA